MSTKKLCNDCPFHTCHVPIGLWDRVWDPLVMACTPLALPQRGGGLNVRMVWPNVKLIVVQKLIVVSVLTLTITTIRVR